jgi:hypothetical protein
MNKEITKFLSRGLIFFLPVIMILGFPALILIRSGELDSFSSFINKQTENKSMLIGLSYRNQNEFIKFETTILRQPRILVLGNSRVMQFRSYFFKNEDEFYNAGGAIAGINEARFFLENMPRKYNPQIIIIGIDHAMLNSAQEVSTENEYYIKTAKASKVSIPGVFAYSWKQVYEDYFSKKFSLGFLFKRSSNNINKIGLNALINNSGFRYDGSYQYGDLNMINNNFNKELNLIDKGESPYLYSGEISKDFIKNLELFLEESKKRNVFIIGFLPPFATSIYQKISDKPIEYDYILNSGPTVEKKFKSYGFEFYDFTNPNYIMADDKDFIDGNHGSEKIYLRLFQRMLKENSALNEEAAGQF